MTAVAESATAINESLHLDEVLLRILEQVSQALEVEIVSLALLDESRKFLEFRASTLGAGESALGLKVPVGQGIAGWVAREGKGLVAPDVQTDPRFYPDVDRITGYETQSIACAPILSNGKVIGVIEAINPQQGGFESDDLLVLAGTAILHAQLFEQLQAAHRRYLELFEDSIDPILITDWEGQIIEANRQAEITAELDKDGLQTMSVGQLHQVDYELVGDNFESLSSGKTISYESTLHVQQKREVPVQVYVREVDIEGKSLLQWILRDITERKNLDNLRDDLISMIYHDLRSPLANVVSSLDVMDTMLPEEEGASLRSLLGIAMRSTERILRLTNSLLDINRLEAGQPVVNLQPIDPSLLAREAVETVLPIAGNKKQELEVEVPPGLPRVLIDADMIRRVLTNLLENAVKFTPPEGKISVGARIQESWIQMWVQDDGAGIPEAERERIFDKYTRLHAKEGPRGIGLGLAYCRLAVEGHGGRIWVEGESGAGARFCFTLPIVNE
jgi:PAS domain S-box-containing protein